MSITDPEAIRTHTESYKEGNVPEERCSQKVDGTFLSELEIFHQYCVAGRHDGERLTRISPSQRGIVMPVTWDAGSG